MNTLDLGFAKIDMEREKRQGFPEVIYCAGKTPEQSAEIFLKLSEHSPNVLATRVDEATKDALLAKVPDAKYYEKARIVALEREPQPKDKDRVITILTAGTSDIPVAEEAAVTASIMGNEVEVVYDVGVAGIHRLFEQMPVIKKANVLIVIAGMEGALASVVGGLVSKPVIAVPTSVGYGASFDGLAALLGMMNSCAAGVAVVNIDNGFGAGRLASIINHMR
ncbi:MAG: nickel pincer cofactor biosynthesis protein LarB [Acidaminococcaceae bacterium]|nr:nickel pincer cofactor biosynthesis protein LarB [Acidaminococcaceae bacterium]MDO4935440.1 nickel pincer cofactor biosynthesis protein LarB [Phascolarctobacterium sp.]